MRVSKSRRREGPQSPKKSEQTSLPRGLSFPELLEVERFEHFDLAQALGEVDELARRLRESPVYGNLLRYRRGVRSILRYLVRRCYTVEESSFYDPQGRRRLMVLVESVDHELEALAKDFLNDQTTSLHLASRLDEIRGLLLDLYS